MPNVCNGVRALGRTSNKRKTNLAEQTVVVPATKRQLKSLSLSLSRLWNVENTSDCESILFGRRPFFWSTAPSIKGEVRRNGAGLGLKWIKAVRSFHFFVFFFDQKKPKKNDRCDESDSGHVRLGFVFPFRWRFFFFFFKVSFSSKIDLWASFQGQTDTHTKDEPENIEPADNVASHDVTWCNFCSMWIAPILWHQTVKWVNLAPTPTLVTPTSETKFRQSKNDESTCRSAFFFLAVNAATVKLPEIQFALHGITSSSTVSPPSTTNAAQHLTDIIAKPHRKV